MTGLSKNSVSRHTVTEDAGGQRVDNYLVKILKGVPKSHVYRILRSGEVRVNGGRTKPDYRVQAGDELRLPPVRIATRPAQTSPPRSEALEQAVLLEDEFLLALDKPAGLAGHGGSGGSFCVIEPLRAQRPDAQVLEPSPRLDRRPARGVSL